MEEGAEKAAAEEDDEEVRVLVKICVRPFAGF